MGILGNVLLGPFKGLWFVIREIHNQVQKELYDEEAIQKQFVALQLEYELGNIPEDEFLRQEAVLFERLNQARTACAAANAGGGE
ncbi:MAG: gas vesicle protein GvpG [Bacillota bacterium]